MFEYFLNLLFPNICGFCNQIDKNSLCKNCEKALLKYELKTIMDFRHDKTKYFDFCFCALKYEDIIRKKIISFKFEEKSYLYKTFAKIIINNKKIYRFIKIYDIIIPVPMYKTKLSVRGYNQSALVARKIAKETKTTFENDILVKIKDTKTQSTLTKKDRIDNLNDAFKVKNEDKIKGKNIILFDDIYTTGSTVNECSKVLKEAGAKKIFVITIAKD